MKFALQLLREALVHLGSESAQIRADAKTVDASDRRTPGNCSKELNMKITLKNP